MSEPLSLYLAVGVPIYLAAYLVARRVQAWGGGSPLLNPVLLAAAPIIAGVELFDLPQIAWQAPGSVLLWFLGPATIAFAVPLYRQWPVVKASWRPILLALVAGSATAVLVAEATAHLLGASQVTIASLAPKSVTTPIAMGVAEKIGGEPALAAAFVIGAGILGAMFAATLFAVIRVRNPRARGFAMGTAAHGIATARAFQVSEEQGTFAGLAMVLNGILTALLLPLWWMLHT